MPLHLEDFLRQIDGAQSPKADLERRRLELAERRQRLAEERFKAQQAQQAQRAQAQAQEREQAQEVDLPKELGATIDRTALMLLIAAALQLLMPLIIIALF